MARVHALTTPQHWSLEAFQDEDEDQKVREWLLTHSGPYRLLAYVKTQNPRVYTDFKRVAPKKLLQSQLSYAAYYRRLIRMRVKDNLFPEGHYEALDLGAAPGGFSQVAVESGLHVVALSLPPAQGGIPFLYKGGESCTFAPLDLAVPHCLSYLIDASRTFKWVNVGVTIGAEQKMRYDTCKDYTASKRSTLTYLVNASLALLAKGGSMFVTLQTTADVMCFAIINHCTPFFHAVTLNPSAKPKSSSVVLVFEGYTRPMEIPSMLPIQHTDDIPQCVSRGYHQLGDQFTKTYLSQADAVSHVTTVNAFRMPEFGAILSG